MAYQHHIDGEKCKGCGLCVAVCPRKVLDISTQINGKGYFPACQARPQDCVFCGNCCLMCPDVAITIIQVVDAAAGKDKREGTHG